MLKEYIGTEALVISKILCFSINSIVLRANEVCVILSCATFLLSFHVFDCREQTVFDFLFSRLAKGHRDQLETFFRIKNVSVDGVMVTSDSVVKEGMKVALLLPDHCEQAVNTKWKLIWENEELMAVFKPPLLPVSRTTRNLYQTLISLVRRETPYVDAHLLHRLDTETSGVLLLAKNKQADQKWKNQLEVLITRKVYHAWVYGEPSWDNKVFICELSEKQDSTIRSQVYVVDSNNMALYIKPRLSKTVFTVLQRCGERSLVQCELVTGRKHQIRAQLAYLGHGIVGDKIYSEQGRFYLKRLNSELNEEDYDVLGSLHQLLFATEVVLNVDGVHVSIKSIHESLGKKT